MIPENLLIDEQQSVTTDLIKTEWLIALSKASSALRFNAENFEHTQPAKEELRKIADTLTEIETEFSNHNTILYGTNEPY